MLSLSLGYWTGDLEMLGLGCWAGDLEMLGLGRWAGDLKTLSLVCWGCWQEFLKMCVSAAVVR